MTLTLFFLFEIENCFWKKWTQINLWGQQGRVGVEYSATMNKVQAFHLPPLKGTSRSFPLWWGMKVFVPRRLDV